MTVADCGFPPIVPQFDANGGLIGVQPGQSVLLSKGPTISVEVGFEASLFAPDPTKVQQAIEAIHAGTLKPGAYKVVEALVDTGAGDSCIDEDLANELALPLIDQTTCSGVGGHHILNVYLGHIRIPALGHMRYGRFIGAKLRAGGQPHETLIGRSAMVGMLMHYDGRTGAVTLAL